MSATERRKGKVAEQQVVRILRRHGWPDAERTTRGVRQLGPCDVKHGPAGCALEVKRQERLNVPAAFDQLARSAGEHDIPILIHRPSRQVWMATLPLEELLPLLALRERAL